MFVGLRLVLDYKKHDGENAQEKTQDPETQGYSNHTKKTDEHALWLACSYTTRRDRCKWPKAIRIRSCVEKSRICESG